MYSEINLNKIEQYYVISKSGKIYNKNTNLEIHPRLTDKGYLWVYLSQLQKRYFVHRLICLKYHPNSNYRQFQVNHIDGVKTNNHYQNLEWCTNKENMIHAVSTGLRDHLNYHGDKNPASKISEKDAILVIQDLLSHKSENEIAKNFNISKSTVSAIKNKRLWSHLTHNIDFDTDYKRKSRSPLTPQQVDQIIAMLLDGKSNKTIAEHIGCKIQAIKDIKYKKTWKDKTQDVIFY